MNFPLDEQPSMQFRTEVFNAFTMQTLTRPTSGAMRQRSDKFCPHKTAGSCSSR